MRTNYKKWLLIIGIPLIIVAIVVISLYNNAQKPYEEAIEKAIQQLQEKTPLAQVDDVYIYNSTAAYYTAIGQDENGENVAVWLQQDGKTEPLIRSLDDGVTENEARALFAKEEGSANLLSLTLGIEGDIPVWQFLFENKNGRLNYYYLSFSDGTWWKKVENI